MFFQLQSIFGPFAKFLKTNIKVRELSWCVLPRAADHILLTNRTSWLEKSDNKAFFPATIKTNFCFLLSQGADLYAVDCDGWNALHYAASDCDDAPTMCLLLDKGLDIKKKTHDGRTALMIATNNDNEAAVDFLLSYAQGRCNNRSLYTHPIIKMATGLLLFLKHLLLLLWSG